MSCLLLTTLSGSILFLEYLLWQKLFDSCLTESMKYRALIMVIFIWPVPWVWIKRPYETLFAVFSGGEMAVGTKWFILAGTVWGSGVLLLATIKSLRYFYERNLFLTLAEECGDGISENTVNALKEELGYKGRLMLLRISGERLSITMGVVKPVIILQETRMLSEQILVLKHELVHIVRRDLLLRLLLELLCCLYWFHPLIYLLRSCFVFVRETSCDERVIRDCTEAEREVYARLITESMKSGKRGLMMGSGFGSDYRRARRRVELIMRGKEISRRRKCAAISCFALLLAADALPAFFCQRILF